MAFSGFTGQKFWLRTELLFAFKRFSTWMILSEESSLRIQTGRRLLKRDPLFLGFRTCHAIPTSDLLQVTQFKVWISNRLFYHGDSFGNFSIKRSSYDEEDLGMKFLARRSGQWFHKLPAKRQLIAIPKSVSHTVTSSTRILTLSPMSLSSHLAVISELQSASSLATLTPSRLVSFS